jgi:hypothetical protein
MLDYSNAFSFYLRFYLLRSIDGLLYNAFFIYALLYAKHHIKQNVNSNWNYEYVCKRIVHIILSVVNVLGVCYTISYNKIM